MYRFIIRPFRINDEIPKDAKFLSSTVIRRVRTKSHYESTVEDVRPEHIVHFFLVRERVETPIVDPLKEIDEECLEE